MQLDCRHSLGPLCGAVALAVVVAASALYAGFGQKTADAAGGETVTPVFAYDLPNLPGQKMIGHLVEYAPAAPGRTTTRPRGRSSPTCSRARFAPR
jgi:hypothetical protein